VLWRNPKPGLIIAQYEPPEDAHILLSALLIDHAHRGLPAQLVDFAVRGLIKIIDTAPHTAAKNRFELEFVTSEGADGQEQRILTMLFGPGAERGTQVNPGRFDSKTGAAL